MDVAQDRRTMVYEKLRPGNALELQLEQRGIEASLPFGPASCLLRQKPLSEDAFIELAAGFPAVLGVSGAKLTRRVLESLPHLRFISKIGIGYDVIDLDAATELGILVTNTPSQVEIDCVAEHAIALMLAAAKRLNIYSTPRLASGRWLDSSISSVALRDRTIGLVGFGRIARAVAIRLQGWGVRLLACDLRALSDEPALGATMVSLEHLLTESDFVSLHVSTATGSRPVLTESNIRLMKSTAVLVNTARGASVDQSALADALSSGGLFAAGLDVFDPEPPVPGERLLTLPNVIATPHLGASPPEAEADMEAMSAENLDILFSGAQPEALLNPHARQKAPARQIVRERPLPGPGRSR